ncbi:MAG: polyamine aminopropyltransferase [Rhodocyclaceae bacterium]|nr:polyamine aminopropyltransferase [Rhodocyclaceae bacterium]
MSEREDLYLVEQLNEDFGYFVRASRVLATGRTRYQDLALYDTPMFGKLLRLDEVFMTSEKDEFFYHENLIHPAAITHPSPRRALVIGGGDGGAAEELLKHPSIEKVVLAELDDGVIDACRTHLASIHRGALEDARVELAIGDGRAYVEAEGAPFDLIALDLTDPHGPSQALYTREFYRACEKRLAPGGLLSLHVESPISRPRTYARIVATLSSVFAIVRPYLVYIPLYGTWWGMAVASMSRDPLTLSEDEVERRLAMRELEELRFYNGAMHRAVFALPNFVREILAAPAEAITDASPPLEDDIALNQRRRLKLSVA